MADENNIIDPIVTDTSLELRIAKAIAPIKKTSERVIGITSTDYEYSVFSYMATTVRPQPITPLERAIVGIIDIDYNASLENIGKILGLDIVHDIAERSMLLESVDKMKGYGMLEGDETYLALTEKGKVFAAEGERPVTYNKVFEISYDPSHPEYLFLSSDFSFAKQTIEKRDLPSDDISLQTIKDFAEVQAPGVQNAKNRYILQSAVLKEASIAKVNLYIIILQSIRDEKEYRIFAYDDTQNSILPNFSKLIQDDQEWSDLLLEKCISNSLQLAAEDGGWTVVPANQEKNEEQKAIEAELIQQEEAEFEGKEDDRNELERLHKKALYDQASFELELNNIFKQDNPDEVWIISPFMSWSFINVRVKQFEPLLKANKKIFIAYSEPYSTRPTIAPEAHDAIMKEINRLSRLYPNFYCVELPQFHTKQVLEVKNGQCVLFNGSFNVLSFNNISAEKKVSREEMALVHHQIAISKHQEYIKTFAAIYSNIILDAIRSSEPKDIINIKCDRIDYLQQISEDKEIFLDFYTEFDEKTLQAKNSAWYDLYDSLIEKVNLAIEKGSINVKEYKTLSAIYSSLLKDVVSLTISSDTVRNLEESYANLESLPKTKENNKKEKLPNDIAHGESTIDMAKEILQNAILDNEISVAKYVSALNLLYFKREIQRSDGVKYLNKLFNHSTGFSYVSVFDYSESKYGPNFDITIGVGGYSFRLLSILPQKMEKKIEAIKKPRGQTKLQNVIKDDIEKTFRTLLNQ